METMTIAIPPDLKKYVQRRVKAGDYVSVSEFMRELIRMDQRKTAMSALEAELLKGLASGPPVPITKSTWKEIRKKVRLQRATRKKN